MSPIILDLISALAPVANAAGHCIHPGVKMVPRCSERFTGRREYLDKLQQYFCRRDVSYPRRCFLLYGMGGAGKTQICLKFAEENADMSALVFHCLLFMLILIDELVQVLANLLG